MKNQSIPLEYKKECRGEAKSKKLNTVKLMIRYEVSGKASWMIFFIEKRHKLNAFEAVHSRLD